MEDVHTMILEPFDLHTTEQLDHSPSDYLSANFKFHLPTEDAGHPIEQKDEADFDALWTKAVDNMFRSSRLFNGDVKDEEKENLNENILESGPEKDMCFDFHIEDEPTLKEEDTLQALEFSSLKQPPLPGEDIKDLNGNEKRLSNGDQIVPISKNSAHKTGSKRAVVDCDVNFSLLPRMGHDGKSQNKKLRLDPENGKEVIVDGDCVADDAPPRNSIFADYCFDSHARLPSFREAFVPSLKKISRREKELRRRLREGDNIREHGNTQSKIKTTSNGSPVEDHKESESRYQSPAVETGAALGQTNDHPVDILSEISDLEKQETIDERSINLLSRETTEKPKLADIASFDENLGKKELKIEIKQEDLGFTDCSRIDNSRDVHDTPSKILDISSANLKDIEKNIFSFDEGLDMLDLEREFPLHNINVNHEHDITNVHQNNDCDWTIGLSNVPDVQTTTERYFCHNINEVKTFMSHNGVVDMPTSGQYLSSTGGVVNSSLGHPMASHNPVQTYTMPVMCSQAGSSMNFSQYDQNAQLSNVITKQNSSAKGFDVLGNSDHGQPDPKLMSLKQNIDFNVLNHDRQRAMAMQMSHAGQQPFTNQHDIKIMKQSQQNLPIHNTIEGQSIAQQIHQSFGADVFGAPGDDGAKILAKYLAQRGSTRNEPNEQQGGMSSAIASLIGKSFSQQEATHRLPRDNGTVEFLTSSDLDHLDLMNDAF